ncbi:hypothetical protein BJ973_000018 [Actinoplanes tereljensis]|uniref:hypothetical protein n=1 Tax=Paractinoplanes tereljensis TaxID=571912 RepID=UPI0019451885|nr:hypothetical protein [Actinoplanes tereljensis]
MTPVFAADQPYTFSAFDIGFNDGGSAAGKPERIGDMVDYLGGTKPIIRAGLDWDRVQPTAGGPLDWTGIDAQVNAAYAKGVRVLLILTYSAPWANGHPDDITWFPTDDNAWRAIVAASVAHFGPKVQAYEVWNEPNILAFGNYGDNRPETRKQRYWELVRIAHQEIRVGCPACVVVAGGSAGGAGDDEPADWLEWAYQHGYGADFDAVADHPYPEWSSAHLPVYAPYSCAGGWPRWYSNFGPPGDVPCSGLAALRAVMEQHGDSAKKIWATEYGFPSAEVNVPASPETVRDALEMGVRMWHDFDFAGPMFIYSFQDTSICPEKPAECHFGLRDVAGLPKEPAYSDVRAALLDQQWGNELPTGRTLFRGMRLTSSDGRFTFEMRADGNVVLDAAGTTIWETRTSTGYPPVQPARRQPGRVRPVRPADLGVGHLGYGQFDAVHAGRPQCRSV